MRIHILSDLHIEFEAFAPPDVSADVVVLAGDIAVGRHALDWAQTTFPGRPVVYVPGNHEFYGGKLALIDEFKQHAHGQLHVLDRDVVNIGDVRFLGAILWTDFQLFGESQRYFAMRHAEECMTDFVAIRHQGRRFTPRASVALHEDSVAWLSKELAKPFEGRTVVVTHHAPSTMSVAPRFKTDPLSPAFASRLEPLIEAQGPDLWIHGHTHDAFDYRIFGTRVVCNPRGYPGEGERLGFDPALVIDLGRSAKHPFPSRLCRRQCVPNGRSFLSYN